MRQDILDSILGAQKLQNDGLRVSLVQRCVLFGPSRGFFVCFCFAHHQNFFEKLTPKWDSVVVYTLKIKRNYIILVD